jgi:hypothetical protein
MRRLVKSARTPRELSDNKLRPPHFSDLTFVPPFAIIILSNEREENNLDKRIRYVIGLDTETCNGIVLQDESLDLTQSLVYDIGWAVTDKRGNIYKTRSFVIYETFIGMKDVMKSAYYADKIPMYWEQIKKGERKLVSLWTARKALFEDVKEFGVKNIFAHNAGFDVRALNNTIRYVSKSKYRYFFPRKIEMWDTLKMSRQTIGRQPSYKQYCERMGFMTRHKVPQVRLTAEIIYRYITGDPHFIESHTGLEDVLIETKIFAHCIRQHKKMERRLYVPRCA